MNVVFWLLIAFAAFAVWWLIRGLFNSIGNYFLKKHDEMQDILNQEEELHIPCEPYDSEYAKSEFKDYFEKELKE